MSKVSGHSTGIDTWNDEKMKSAQAKRFKQFKSRFGDYRGADLKPTPEQIALKKKRAEEEARLQAKLKAKRHRGGYHKTKKAKRDKSGKVVIGDNLLNHWMFEGLKNNYPLCCIFWFENVWSQFRNLPTPNDQHPRIGNSDMVKECDIWYKTEEGYIRCPECIAQGMEDEWCE